MEESEIRQGRIQATSLLISITLIAAGAIILIISQDSGKEGDKIILEQRINPNSEPVGSLLRLPGIGISKANAIVIYREEFVLENEHRPAFKQYRDLENVEGIGPKTADNICGYLKFE